MGDPLGACVGAAEGNKVGDPVGAALGHIVGAPVGPALGASVGAGVGPVVGASVGNGVGPVVGAAVGAVGEVVGADVGAVGAVVGASVGSSVGLFVGDSVGAAVGLVVGSGVNRVAHAPPSPILPLPHISQSVHRIKLVATFSARVIWTAIFLINADCKVAVSTISSSTFGKACSFVNVKAVMTPLNSPDPGVRPK